MRKPGLREAFADTAGVLVDALRLMWRHWPVLMVFAFAGVGARHAILEGAFHVSDFNGVLGIMMVVLAPIAFLASYILMLRAVRSSMPALNATAEHHVTAEGVRRRTAIDYLGIALVPFLIVYGAQDYLRQDLKSYAGRVLIDEIYGNMWIGLVDPSKATTQKDIDDRFPLTTSVLLIGIVVVAVIVRWLLGRWVGRMTWLGIPAAYVEAVWIGVGAVLIGVHRNKIEDWITSRRVWRATGDLVDSIVDRLGPLNWLGKATVTHIEEMVGSVDRVLIVPIAWLAIGAIVYGQRVGPPPRTAEDLFERATRRRVHLPKPLRWFGSQLSGDLRKRFAPLTGGLRLVLRAGLRPMLLFCLAFLIAQTAGRWLWELLRLIIGPQQYFAVGMGAYQMAELTADALRAIVLICLLAAAINRVVNVQRLDDATEVAKDDTPPATAAAAVPVGGQAGSRA